MPALFVLVRHLGPLPGCSECLVEFPREKGLSMSNTEQQLQWQAQAWLASYKRTLSQQSNVVFEIVQVVTAQSSKHQLTGIQKLLSSKIRIEPNRWKLTESGETQRVLYITSQTNSVATFLLQSLLQNLQCSSCVSVVEQSTCNSCLLFFLSSVLGASGLYTCSLHVAPRQFLNHHIGTV